MNAKEMIEAVLEGESVESIMEIKAKFNEPVVAKSGIGGQFEIRAIVRAPRMSYFWNGKKWTTNQPESKQFDSTFEAKRDLDKATQIWNKHYK